MMNIHTAVSMVGTLLVVSVVGGHGNWPWEETNIHIDKHKRNSYGGGGDSGFAIYLPTCL